MRIYFFPNSTLMIFRCKPHLHSGTINDDGPLPIFKKEMIFFSTTDLYTDHIYEKFENCEIMHELF